MYFTSKVRASLRRGDVSTRFSRLQEVVDIQILGEGSAWASVGEEWGTGSSQR